MRKIHISSNTIMVYHNTTTEIRPDCFVLKFFTTPNLWGGGMNLLYIPRPFPTVVTIAQVNVGSIIWRTYPGSSPKYISANHFS